MQIELQQQAKSKTPERESKRKSASYKYEKKYDKRRTSKTPDKEKLTYPSNWSEIKQKQLPLEDVKHLRFKCLGSLKNDASE